MSLDLLIQGGTVFGTGIAETANVSVAVQDGKIVGLLPDGEVVSSKRVIDANGLFVTPGFVDTHMHDEYFSDVCTAQHALLKQGVTTCIGGHCGMGLAFAKPLEMRRNPWVNLSYFVGNCALREAAGHTDRYTAATESELSAMLGLLRQSLEQGALGLSLGLQYAPGVSAEEVSALAELTASYPNRSITAHMRFDDKRCTDAVKEMIDIAKQHGIRTVISHLGSMTVNHTRKCIALIDEARKSGVDIWFDCYPYTAFCTEAGSAVFDDGFVERWEGKGCECLEAASGRFRGQRLTEETLAIMRAEEPSALIVAHVMDADEVLSALQYPESIIASDTLCTAGGGHPRAAGAFPRAFSILRKNGSSWADVIRKATSLPATVHRLNAGRLSVGSSADIVLFDPKTLIDRATFQNPFIPPLGMRMVIVNGNVAVEEGELSEQPHGRLFMRDQLGATTFLEKEGACSDR